MGYFNFMILSTSAELGKKSLIIEKHRISFEISQILMILHHFIFPHFSNVTHGGIEKSKYQENIPEMNVSEPDLIFAKKINKKYSKTKKFENFDVSKKIKAFYFL